ncbi:MAG: DUF4837 family protein [bacterium]
MPNPSKLLAFIVLAAGLSLSCGEQMIAAFGSNSGIAIITDRRCEGLARELKETLEREVQTVQREKWFEVEIFFFSGRREEFNHKNIIILDYLSPKSRLQGKIRTVAGKEFDELRRGRKNFVVKYDLWAKGQVVVVLSAPERPALDLLLSQQPDRILELVDHCVQTRLNRALFYPGEQRMVSERLLEDYGWTLRLPSGYKVNEKFAKDGIVKILKDQPARMITIWALGKSKEDDTSCLDLKKRLAWEYWDEDVVVEDGLKIENGKFAGNEATIISGKWENQKYTIGGIFETYCFECKECQCYYIVDLAVFAPGLTKLPLLRELRAIASTFSCQSSI